MRKSVFFGVTGVLLLAAQGAHAQFSSTVTVISDYDFRGVSFSAEDPALQGSVDYAFPNGFAVGAWASNFDFGPLVDGDIELDLYAGYTGALTEESSWTAGLVYYTYPGSDDVDEYPEVYAGFAYGPFSLKQWYSNDFVAADESAWYTEANYGIELPANFSLLLHAGYSYGDFWDDLGGGELLDYAVGLGYAAGNFSLGLKLTGTDASGAQKITDEVLNNEARVLLSVATTFPWGE